MGCWNKTCGLSNLHIYAGTPVYVFPINQNTVFTDRCYTTALWEPSLMPFLSIYNDYGGGEDSSGIAFEPTIEALRNQLVEMEVGENEYHDIAVKRNNFGEKQFFESVHEGRLMVRDWQGKNALVDFVMMRKDIVDQVLSTHYVETYVGDSKGTCGYDNNYIRYTFADVVAGLPEFFAKIREKTSKALPEFDSVDPADPEYNKAKAAIAALRKIHAISDDLSTIYEWKDRTITARYFTGDGSRQFQLVNWAENLVDAIIAGDEVLATELATTYLVGKFIDEFMSDCRKVWIPACHEGSQSADLTAYKTLNSVTSTAIAQEEKSRADDD